LFVDIPKPQHWRSNVKQLTYRILLLVCLAAVCGCSSQKEPPPDPRYIPQNDFVLCLKASSGIHWGRLFLLEGNRQFLVLTYDAQKKAPETSTVSSGQITTGEFDVVLHVLRKTNLLDLEKEEGPQVAVPDSVDYSVLLINGACTKAMSFMPDDHRFKPLIDKLRPIMTKGKELKGGDELAALRKVSSMDEIYPGNHIGYMLGYNGSPEARALLQELIENKKADPFFKRYLRDKK
jgi:hypothetical protein